MPEKLPNTTITESSARESERQKLTDALKEREENYDDLIEQIHQYGVEIKESNTQKWRFDQWETLFERMKKAQSNQMMLIAFHIDTPSDLRRIPLEGGLAAVYRAWSLHPFHARRCFESPELLVIPRAATILRDAALLEPEHALLSPDRWANKFFTPEEDLAILCSAATQLSSRDLAYVQKRYTGKDELAKDKLAKFFADPNSAMSVINTCLQQRLRQQEMVREGRLLLLRNPQYMKMIEEASIDEEPTRSTSESTIAFVNDDDAVAMNFSAVYPWIQEFVTESTKKADGGTRMTNLAIIVARALSAQNRFHNDALGPLKGKEIADEIVTHCKTLNECGTRKILQGNILCLASNRVHRDLRISPKKAEERALREKIVAFQYAPPIIQDTLSECAKKSGGTYETYRPLHDETKEQILEKAINKIIDGKPPFCLVLEGHGNSEGFSIDPYKEVFIPPYLLAQAYYARYRKYGRSTENDVIVVMTCSSNNIITHFQSSLDHLLPKDAPRPMMVGMSETAQVGHNDDIQSPTQLDQTITSVWDLLLNTERKESKTVREFYDANFIRREGRGNPVLYIPRRNKAGKIFPLQISRNTSPWRNERTMS